MLSWRRKSASFKKGQELDELNFQNFYDHHTKIPYKGTFLNSVFGGGWSEFLY